MKKTTILLACSAMFLAACGGKPTPTPAESSEPAPAEVTISQQFVGRYDEMASFGFDYWAILNLYSDGTLQLSGYQVLSKDTSDYKENKGFSYDWGHGNWKVGKDEEGDDATIMSITYGKDQTNVMTGEPNVGTFKYTLYPGANGACSFTCNLPIVSGREAQMVSDGTVQFADYNAFIQAKKYAFTEPTNAIAHLDSENAHSRIYLLDDHKALWVHQGSADNIASFSEFQTGSWSNAGSLVLTFGSESKTAEVTGTTATVTLTYDPYAGYSDPVQATFTGDVANVPAEDPSEVTLKYTFTNTEGTASYKMYSDGTGRFDCKAGGYDLGEDSTWSWASYTLIIKVGETEKVHASPDGTTYQLSFTYTYSVAGHDMPYSFSCGADAYMQF
ncbi:MAG: hypothetical protein MJ241_04110 [Bacilli bacterium]|nr:hypothetical protein [Bacilli bacterium]